MNTLLYVKLLVPLLFLYKALKVLQDLQQYDHFYAYEIICLAQVYPAATRH